MLTTTALSCDVSPCNSTISDRDSDVTYLRNNTRTRQVTSPVLIPSETSHFNVEPVSTEHNFDADNDQIKDERIKDLTWVVEGYESLFEYLHEKIQALEKHKADSSSIIQSLQKRLYDALNEKKSVVEDHNRLQIQLHSLQSTIADAFMHSDSKKRKR